MSALGPIFIFNTSYQMIHRHSFEYFTQSHSSSSNQELPPQRKARRFFFNEIHEKNKGQTSFWKEVYAMFFDDKLAAFHASARNAQDVIHIGSQLLLDAGDVKPDFEENILKREQDYPTGLEIGYTGVAIPHTDSRFVNKSQIAFVSLKKPVVFRYMIDRDKAVQAILVFIIAMSQPHEQADALGDLVGMLSNQKAVKCLQACTSMEMLEAILTENHIC
ncbi:mannitol/fructose-specific phosphotransferase system IIA component (Ntr-type) [Olsenella profusa DSM 13989]|nr:mannitol/fructose-specific phosphotransferase system IIA component (Ntr-type) [Olsenella profusa DSM 13989]